MLVLVGCFLTDSKCSFSSECLVKFTNSVLDLVKCSQVFNSGRNFVFHVVCYALDCSAKNFSTTSLGEPVHKDDTMESSKGANISSDFGIYDFLQVSNLLRTHLSSSGSPQNDKSKRAFTTHLIVISNNSAFNNAFVLVDDLFETAC